MATDKVTNLNKDALESKLTTLKKDGMRGSTQGEKKESMPAKKTKSKDGYSIIIELRLMPNTALFQKKPANAHHAYGLYS